MPFCNQCGHEYQIGDTTCKKCGASLPAIPDDSSKIKKITKVQNPKLKRFLAGVIDIFVAAAILLFFFSSRRLTIAIFLKRGIGILAPHLYLLLKDSIEGKSVGKLILGIMVFNKKEEKVGGIFDSIIRNWYLAIPFIGPTIFAFIIGVQILTGKGKRLGDEGAGTIIISDSDYLGNR